MRDVIDDILAGIKARMERKADDRAAEAELMTLGELELALGVQNPDMPVVFEDGEPPGDFGSYRGYYRYVALDKGRSDKSVQQFREQVFEAIGATFTGYNGGEFKMTRQTPVWASAYGISSGNGIVGVEQQADRVVLKVARIDED